jgi:hypothetical protein
MKALTIFMKSVSTFIRTLLIFMKSLTFFKKFPIAFMKNFRKLVAFLKKCKILMMPNNKFGRVSFTIL